MSENNIDNEKEKYMLLQINHSLRKITLIWIGMLILTIVLGLSFLFSQTIISLILFIVVTIGTVIITYLFGKAKGAESLALKLLNQEEK